MNGVSHHTVRKNNSNEIQLDNSRTTVTGTELQIIKGQLLSAPLHLFLTSHYLFKILKLFLMCKISFQNIYFEMDIKECKNKF